MDTRADFVRIFEAAEGFSRAASSADRRALDASIVETVLRTVATEPETQ